MTPPSRRIAVVTILVAAALAAGSRLPTATPEATTLPRATVPMSQAAPTNNMSSWLTTVPLATIDSTARTSEASTPNPVVSPPRHVSIPSIEVEATIIDLGLTSDGALETPTDFDMAGWWAGGTVADEAGPTVIVGHVDDRNGPAVFFRLQELEPGDHVTVIDDLGRETRFTVVDKGIYDKTSFPTDRVYGDTDTPTLRLVTCGGEFDLAERSYESNWVVYAVAA